ncbi:hypothetical protein [Devosia rhizoryzae]|uniref:DUF1311 domain-containing protein n=1 Tax=Devosia rhizoryzae TaxID=2774137 RepID=A0ABX7C782_9HYPH|nr:hypothetical protein [Devosia rhizoryzae]QQR39054.1 hypothetical protein JI748_15165 [Devosia rhizoryzae]
MRHFLAALVFSLLVPQAFASDPEDLVDCDQAESRFEIVLCSNQGAFDLINHVHQTIFFGPVGPDLEAIKQDWGTWIREVEQGCMQSQDTRFASGCLYDAGASPSAQNFIARVDALYPHGSDTEGSDECDGCDFAEKDRPFEVAVDTKMAAISEEQLTEIYTGYLLVSLCAEYGSQFDAKDVEAMELASKQAEAAMSQQQRETAWSSASSQADSARVVFQISFAQGTEMCDGARLFVGGIINEHRQATPKPF